MTSQARASAADVLEHGHRWLKFPPGLEDQFQAHSLEPRRKLLFTCGLIGVVSICLGAVKLAELAPDIVDVAFRNLYLILAISLAGLAAFWLVPARLRRNWQAEASTATCIVALNAGLIYACMISRADTVFTHSAAVITAVMYACIAARLRFVWSVGCALTSFAAYVLLVRGHTPQQDLIIASTIKLMAVSYAFGLAANYAFEHRERRNWLLRQRAAEQRAALTETSQRLHRLSVQDPLTGLYNRRQFDAALAQAWSQAQQGMTPVALLSVDVDFFKRYNDSYGHPAGDACLVKVARELDKVAQAQGGMAARLGGEEFALLLPGATLDQVFQTGAAVCEGVRLACIEHQASDVSGHVTVSAGVAQLWPAQGGVAQTLIHLADRALYRAKEAGRHRVCAASPADLLEAPTPAAVPWIEPVSEPDTATAESPYLRTLTGGFRQLRFPADQEAAYRHHDADERRNRLGAMAVLGLLMTNAYGLASRAMFPDIEHGTLVWQIGISLLLLLVTGLSHVIRMPVLHREALFSLGTGVLAVGSAWALSFSQQLTTLAYAACLALIPMFAGVGLRQPFWFTCVPSVITCLAVGLLLRPVGAVQELVFADTLLLIATNTMFTLILAYTLEYGARKAWLLSHIERLQGEALQTATQGLHQLSMLDPLTGIRNRRQFEEDLHHIWLEAARTRQPVALLMIDVDCFKLYNDHHGHPMGDHCLRQIASTIDQIALEGQGRAARLGGEEFGMLLPGATMAQAVQWGERLREAVKALGIEHPHSMVTGRSMVTVSVGAACVVAAPAGNARVLFSEADAALYQAKNLGRDRVKAATPPQVNPARPRFSRSHPQALS